MTPDEAESRLREHAESIRDAINAAVAEGISTEHPDGNPFSANGVLLTLRDSDDHVHEMVVYEEDGGRWTCAPPKYPSYPQ